AGEELVDDLLDSSHELISLGHVSPFPEGRGDHDSPLVPDSDHELFVHGAEWSHSLCWWHRGNLVAPQLSTRGWKWLYPRRAVPHSGMTVHYVEAIAGGTPR